MCFLDCSVPLSSVIIIIIIMVAVWLSTNTVTSAKLIYVEPGYHRNG